MADNSAVMQRQHELVTMQQEAAVDALRPSRVFQRSLRVLQDGNQFFCMFTGGDPKTDLQYGVCGFGDTPEAATIAFDAVWLEKVRSPRTV